jgi:lipoprotein-anchoring transpeptidase ErfK/SrfK
MSGTAERSSRSLFVMRALTLIGLAALLVAAVLAPGAGAGGGVATTGLRPVARVQVVGAGRIAWERVAVRARPSRDARLVATLTQFRPDFRIRYVLALAAKRDADGKPLWYRISVPGRPNGRTGWIPASAAEVAPVDRWLVVYRGARKFEFYVRGKLRRTGRVAVGAPGAETPLGLYYVQSKFDPTWPVLGAYAFETSAYSRLSDWPGGGVVGVHGTNTPWLLGQAVSHGCVRLHNDDIQYLRSLVPLGTPVKIVAA